MKNTYGLPAVVAINRFPTDTDAEIALVIEECKKLGVNAFYQMSGQKAAMAELNWHRRLCGCAKNPMFPLLL